MAKINQFGGSGVSQGDARDCLPFETMLADAIDGTLSAEDQRRFNEHLATCDDCTPMLADARQGAALLEALRPDPPQPSPALLDRIFAQTSVLRAQEQEAFRAERRAAQAAASLLGHSAASVPPSSTTPSLASNVLPFRQRLLVRLHTARATVLQPRFAMTAAMAFFSIALTLNLTGVRLSEFRASDLRPGNVKRGMYEAQARVVRYYTNLRVVYELESRVRDLQRSNDSDGSADHPSSRPADAQGNAQPAGGTGANDAAPASKDSGAPSARPDASAPGKGSPGQQPKPKPKPNSGTSRCDWPAGAIRLAGLHLDPRAVSAPPLSMVDFAFTPATSRGERGIV